MYFFRGDTNMAELQQRQASAARLASTCAGLQISVTLNPNFLNWARISLPANASLQVLFLRRSLAQQSSGGDLGQNENGCIQKTHDCKPAIGAHRNQGLVQVAAHLCGESAEQEGKEHES